MKAVKWKDVKELYQNRLFFDRSDWPDVKTGEEVTFDIVGTPFTVVGREQVDDSPIIDDEAIINNPSFMNREEWLAEWPEHADLWPENLEIQ